MVFNTTATALRFCGGRAASKVASFSRLEKRPIVLYNIGKIHMF